MTAKFHRLAIAATLAWFGSAAPAIADCSLTLQRTADALKEIKTFCTTTACRDAITPSVANGCTEPHIAAAVAALRNNDPAKPVVILLGEVHDNPHHHRLRAALIEDAANPVAVPVVEHLPATLQTAVDDFNKSRTVAGRNATAFFDAVGWSKLGWPDAAIFAPLYGVLLRQTAPIVAADVPKDRIRKLARREPGALDADERVRLRLDEPLPAHLQEDLLTELEASHCGMMPKSAFGGMAAAQNYRDAHIAAAAIDAARKTGAAVILAGNGHVRRDRAVPYYISKFAPDVRVIAVGLLEEGSGAPPDVPSALYDAIVVTPRTLRPDPCEEMRKMRRQNPKN